MGKFFHRSGKFLAPSDELAEKALSKLDQGEAVELEMHRVRSVKWHRLYFGCCREIGLMQEPVRDESSIYLEIRVRAGHYDVLIVGKHEVWTPKRINFRAMTAEAWSQYFQKADQVMLNHFGFDSSLWGKI